MIYDAQGRPIRSAETDPQSAETAETPTDPPARKKRRVALRRPSVILRCLPAVVFVYILYLYIDSPNAEETRRLARSAHMIVKKTTTESREVAIETVGDEFTYALDVPLENVSQHFINALLATEDRPFMKRGVFYKVAYKFYKFVGAALQCGWFRLRGNKTPCPGNSTISQQLARNLWIAERRTLRRKVRELMWAVKMDLTLGADEILTYYVNRIPLGKRVFGIESAARHYFGKRAKYLNELEAVMIAAAVKHPSRNFRSDPETAKRRAEIIWRAMKKEGYLPGRKPFPRRHFSHPIVRGKKTYRKPYFGHLKLWLMPQLKKLLAEHPDGQYQVQTTVQAEAQIYAEVALDNGVHKFRQDGAGQAALVSMRPSGEIVAMVGGAGARVRAARAYNRATETKGMHPRPPASAFKPIVYLAALEEGLRPGSRIKADDITISDGNRRYRPRNVDGKSYGSTTLENALVKSINTAAVRLAHDHLSLPVIIRMATRLGIQRKWLKEQWGLALGGCGIPLDEMTAAYSVFANGGVRAEPFAIVAVYDVNGSVTWSRRQPRATRVVKCSHIRHLNRMLGEVINRGTGKPARSNLVGPLAGKTGTGDDHVDAWFVGYTPDLVTGVWIGNDYPRTMEDIWGRDAAVLWNRYMVNITTNMQHVERPLGQFPSCK